MREIGGLEDASDHLAVAGLARIALEGDGDLVLLSCVAKVRADPPTHLLGGRASLAQRLERLTGHVVEELSGHGPVETVQPAERAANQVQPHRRDQGAERGQHAGLGREDHRRALQ